MTVASMTHSNESTSNGSLTEPTGNPSSMRPYRWAIALTATTFPLIWLGGLVTTYNAGMAVPDWPGTYGYNLWLYPWTTWIFGPFDLFVEHGHRLLATVVGLIAIALVLSAYRSDGRRWFARWTVLVLLAVIAQGVLGGFRVVLDARTMAMVHGCTGPLFFAMATATAVMSSRWWRDAPKTGRPSVGIWTAVFLLAASFCQLVIGAQLRHIQPTVSPRIFTMWVHLHLTIALVVTMTIFWVAYASLRRKGQDSGEYRPVRGC